MPGPRTEQKLRAEGNRWVLEGRPTHEELAATIGATRETVTRALGLLRERGLVQGRYS